MNKALKKSMRPKARMPLVCLALLALIATLPAAPYVAIRAGSVYNGNKEVGSLDVNTVYECGALELATRDTYGHPYIPTPPFLAVAAWYAAILAWRFHMWAH